MGYIKDDGQLKAIYGYRGNHPRFSRASWKICVASDGTQEGYWRWVTLQLIKEFEIMSDEERELAKKQDVEHLIEIGYYR